MDIADRMTREENKGGMAMNIELEPWNFAKEGRHSPGKVSDTEWEDYWLACLGDAGITGLEMIQPQSWFVDASTINGKNLEIILEKALQDYDPDTPPAEYINCISGGLALLIGDTVMIEPECCGDLGDVQEWKAAASRLGNAYMDLWIGHPWLLTRSDKEWIELVYADDDNKPDISKMEALKLRRNDLTQAVNEAEVNLRKFERNVETTLQDMNWTNTETIAQLLAFGAD